MAIMNEEDPLILYKFNGLQSRTANLKSVESLKKEFKCESITIKKYNPTYLLPEFGCYRKFMKQILLKFHTTITVSTY